MCQLTHLAATSFESHTRIGPSCKSKLAQFALSVTTLATHHEHTSSQPAIHCRHGRIHISCVRPKLAVILWRLRAEPLLHAETNHSGQRDAAGNCLDLPHRRCAAG